MKKYSILTYIFNNYEKLKQPEYIDKDVEYVCVTDDPSLTSDIWKIVVDEKILHLSTFEKCYHVRFHPFEYAATDICVRIDGSMVPCKSLDDIIEKFKNSEADIALKPHPDRFNILDELNIWVQVRNYSKTYVERQIKYMQEHGYDLNRKNLIECNISIHKNTNTGKIINEAFYSTLKDIGGNEIERLDQTVVSFLMDSEFKNVPVMLLPPLLCEYDLNFKRFTHEGESAAHHRDGRTNTGFFRNIEYSHYMSQKHVFILGVTDNDLGRQIAEEIKANLPEFNIIEIVHSLDTYEEEPIRFAKKYAMEHHCPVGYIHTKGSVNASQTQENVRKCWYNELHTKDYFKFEHSCSVNTPFSGIAKSTFFNMFVADEEAWSALEINYDLFFQHFDPKDKRYYWEGIWYFCPNVTVNGLVYSNLQENEHNKMFNYVNNQR